MSPEFFGRKDEISVMSPEFFEISVMSPEFFLNS
jgi:hypothetical protein